MGLPKVGHAGLTWHRRPGNVELLFVVKALLWESGNEEGKGMRSSVRLAGKRAVLGCCWGDTGDVIDSWSPLGTSHGLSCFQHPLASWSWRDRGCHPGLGGV